MPETPEGYDAVCGFCRDPFTFRNARLSGAANWQGYCCRGCEGDAAAGKVMRPRGVGRYALSVLGRMRDEGRVSIPPGTGRNCMPRLIKHDLAEHSKEQSGYVLTKRGRRLVEQEFGAQGDAALRLVS